MANWGGRRIGSGRKRGVKSPPKVVQHPSVPVQAPVPEPEPSPIEEFGPPDHLSSEEKAVWQQQAPHAFKHRTLTPASALAFERYCQVVVLERNEAKGSGVSGSNHRGLLKLIQAYETNFMLIPMGKPMIEPAQPQTPAVDENDAFFGDPGVRRA